jgi:hypothetical protein
MGTLLGVLGPLSFPLCFRFIVLADHFLCSMAVALSAPNLHASLFDRFLAWEKVGLT